MPDYQLAPAARRDLKAIFKYSLKKWEEEQAEKYVATLKAHFSALAHGERQTKAELESRPELRRSRCEHHHVFHYHRRASPPLVIAVFHKRMDLMIRLQRRLRSIST